MNEEEFDYKPLKDFWSVYALLSAIGLGISFLGIEGMLLVYIKDLIIISFSILLAIKIIVLLGLFSKHKVVFRKIAFVVLLLFLAALVYVLFFSITLLFSYAGAIVLLTLPITLAYFGLTIYGIKTIKAGSLFVSQQELENSTAINPKIITFWIIIGGVLVLPAIVSIISARPRFSQFWQLLAVFFVYSIWLKRESKYFKWAFIYIIIQTLISLFYFIRALIPIFIEGLQYLTESPFGIIAIVLQVGIVTFLFWGIKIHYKELKN